MHNWVLTRFDLLSIADVKYVDSVVILMMVRILRDVAVIDTSSIPPLR